MHSKQIRNRVNIVFLFFAGALLFFILFYDSHLKHINQYALQNGFGRLNY